MADVEQPVGESDILDDKTRNDKDDNSLGISDGRVPDNCMFSSSVLNQSCGANQARLHKQPYMDKYGAWTPLYDDKNQYLDIDLGEEFQIGAIATQGRPAFTEDGGWYVESYSLAYGNDGDNFQNLREYGISKVFEGNKDAETVVKNQFKAAIKCRWVRVKPVTWHCRAALRVELYKFTGKSPNSRKNQKQVQKSTAERGARQNSRGGRPEPLKQVKDSLHNVSPIRTNDAQQICIVDAAKEVDSLSKSSEKVQINGGRENQSRDRDTGSIKVPDPSIAADKQGSFEVIETTMEEQVTPKKRVLIESESEGNNNEVKARLREDFHGKSDSTTTANVRDQPDVFKNRPALATTDPAYRMKIKGASAVATRSDGSKFIGKIKLIKKEEEPPEEDDNEEVSQKQGPDYVVPDVVKERLDSYQEVMLRNKEGRSGNRSNNRKSLILEEDLKYLDEMDSSVFDRLKQFKETESKSKEDMEMSKQEEEKRQSMKRDAEQKRLMTLQKEKERMLALLQKQKEEEEEQRRRKEEAEAENFEEIEVEESIPQVPAVVNDRLKLFKESEQKEKEKQEISKQEEERRQSMKRDAEQKRLLTLQKEKERMLALLQKQKEEEEEQLRRKEEAEAKKLEEIQVEDSKQEVPAVVNDRLKLFKENEQKEKQKQEAMKVEAEKRRLAKEDAERKRLLAEEKERERLQELLNKKQKELEEQKKSLQNEDSEPIVSSDVTDGPEEPLMPAIVHDRIKIFKEGAKADKEKQEALRIEAQKRRAAAEEAERMRILAEEKAREEMPPSQVNNAAGLDEDEIVVAEENFVVESEMAFDFMEEEPVQNEVPVKEVFEERQDKNQESLDLQTKLQGIDTHHEGYDPDHERKMLEEAEEAFRTYAAHQKGGSKGKRSSKTENLIRSFTVESSGSNEPPPSKQDGSKMESQRKPFQKAKSVDDLVFTEVKNVPEEQVNYTVSGIEVRDESKDALVKGFVKDRASIFSKHTPPAAGEKSETAHAQVKNWIASHPHSEAGTDDSERLLLMSQLEELESRSKKLNEDIAKQKAEGKAEGRSVELVDSLNANMREISKIQRRLLQIQKGHGNATRNTTSESSEARSIPDDAGSDKASSSGSRSTHKGGSLKLSRECKAPVDKPIPPVDVNSYNDDGDIVIEGNVLSQIKNYEDESVRQRKQMAQLRKSLSQSRSSIDSVESPPPMGYGGPEFAKSKEKLSKECKLQRDAPLPPVDQKGFNEDGDCVPEGNVLQQIKTFSKSAS